MSQILLGVAGGIAAYKACELLRRLRAAGHDVRVVPTQNALTFVGTATWEALSGHPVHTSVFADVDQVPHVALGQQADLLIVAPATADLLARAATGRADDLLTNCLLTARCPVLFAPAMHTEMWHHPATVANVATLRSRGAVVIEPDSGRLTGSDTGPGRLPDPEELAAIALTVLDTPQIAAQAAAADLAGLTVLVTAGGTREPLDPVRFLGNASSGLMGWALTRAALLRGAQVRLIAAHVSLPAPGGADLVEVGSTVELHQAAERSAPDADLVVMAAAPADFRPAEAQLSKIKKEQAGEQLDLRLHQNPDILAGLVRARTDARQVIVGFAAETAQSEEELVELGRAKLRRKGCDLLVLNAVGGGRVFGQSDSAITVLGPDSSDGPYTGTKDTLAHRIWDIALAVRAER